MITSNAIQTIKKITTLFLSCLNLVLLSFKKNILLIIIFSLIFIMENDEYTLVSDDGNNSSVMSGTTILTNQTFAKLAKSIEGEQSNYGYSMIL